MSLCSWDPSGPSFAVVTEGNLISVFDSDTGRLLQRIPLAFRLTIRYTCLLYFIPGSLSEGTDSPTGRPSKRRRVTSSRPYICCGSSSGHVFVFSASTGDLIKEIDLPTSSNLLGIQHVGPSDEVIVVSSSTSLLPSSLSSDPSTTPSLRRLPNVCDRTVKSTVSPVRLITPSTSSRPSNTILTLSSCWSPDGSYSVVAVSYPGLVGVFDLLSGELLPPGLVPTHPTGSSMVKIVPLLSSPLKRFLVAAGCVQDRYVSVFTVGQVDDTNANDTFPRCVLSTQTHPIQIDVNSTYDVLAVTQDGFIHVWKTPLVETEAKPEEEQSVNFPTFTIRANVENERRVHIIAGRFNPSQTNEITIVTGTIFSPSFNTVLLPSTSSSSSSTTTSTSDRDDNIPITVRVTHRNEEEEEMDTEQHSLRDSVGSGSGSGSNVLEPDSAEGRPGRQQLVFGEVNMNENLARFASVFPSSSSSSSTSTSTDADEDGDIVMSEEKEEREERREGVSSSMIPTLQVTSTLFEALKYSDESSLHSVLSIDNPELISSTISNLPSVMAIKLLDALVNRYRVISVGGGGGGDSNSSFRSSVALPRWLKALFLHHAETLLRAREGIVQKLAPLYHALSARLESFPMLLDLSGRLELLLALGGSVLDEDEEESNGESDDEIDGPREQIVEVVRSLRGDEGINVEEERDLLDDEEDLRRAGSNVFGVSRQMGLGNLGREMRAVEEEEDGDEDMLKEDDELLEGLLKELDEEVEQHEIEGFEDDDDDQMDMD